ncbi:MAG: hypothetical protein IPN32_23330 [Deltaproteobacteria bacterium]|nr:hypothetical protein [Deltaproteobacteria bacterium]
MWPLLVASLVVGVQPPAVIPEPPPGAHEITRVVVLLPAAGDRRLEDVVASVRANLPAAQVVLVELEADGDDTVSSRMAEAVRAAKAQGARGVFWFDLRDPDQWRVYLHVPGRKALLRRRVPEAAASVEAAIEAMWLIVRSGSLALSRGVDVAMESVDPATVDPPPAPATPTVAPPRPPTAIAPPATASRRAPRWWWSLGYLGLGLARRVPWQSGGAIGLRYDVHRNVGIGLAYELVGGAALREPTALGVLRHGLGPMLAVGGGCGCALAAGGAGVPGAGAVGVAGRGPGTSRRAARGQARGRARARGGVDPTPATRAGAGVRCRADAPELRALWAGLAVVHRRRP